MMLKQLIERVQEHAREYMQRPHLLALGLAAAATLLAHLYLRSYETELSGGDRIGLVYLTKDIKAGTILTSEALAVRLVPLAYVDERDVRVRDRDKVVGVAASFDLGTQQKLQWTDLTVRQDSRLISQLIVPGKRAVAVDFGRRDTAALQLVRPGDYVDVIATNTADEARMTSAVLLQSVLVVAVGDRTEREPDGVKQPKEGRVQPPRTLTLSLDLDESQLLALAAARGELSVAVRNQEDLRRFEDVPELRVGNLEEGQRVVRDRKQARLLAGPVRLEEAK
jgi:pilus assembly protein CpaB